MNITISQITNGWVVTVVLSKGQSALYFTTFQQALEEVADMYKAYEEQMKASAKNNAPQGASAKAA